MKQLIIAIVYLGPFLPKYVILNLLDLKNRFPNRELIFICDNSDVAERVEMLGIEVLQVNLDLRFRKHFEQSTSLPGNFRSGFWFYTLARISALAEAQTRLGCSLLQLEADNWIADNFPFEQFRKVECSIAFPLESEDKGSASVLFLKDEESSNQLLQYAFDLLPSNNDLTDMTLLGRLRSSVNFKVQHLPSLPKFDLETRKFESFTTADIEFFGGIFDALPYGMCLMGEDPRNHRGYTRFNHIYGHQLVPLTPFDFEVAHSQNRIDLIDVSGATTALFNLHIHSKELEVWKHQGRRSISMRARRRIHNKKSYSEIRWIIFLEQLVKAIKRRVSSDAQ